MSTQATDEHDLARFGYKQELARDLGKFSSFAAGFSYISILTGVPQLFYIGYGTGGPAFFWTWPLVFVGQLMVALCFAEVASRYPIAGSVYSWSRRVGGPATGWLAGWVYLACLLATLAAVALAMQTTLPQISPLFQIMGPLSDPGASARNAVLLGCVLIGFTTAINAIGVRLLAWINNAGVFAELLGLVGLAALLFVHAVRGPAVILDPMGHVGPGGGYMGPFLAAALMASYVMYGFDTAGSLAEETANPRRTVPAAILQALGAAGIGGALVLLGALMAAPDLASPLLGKAEGGLPGIVQAVLGSGLGTFFIADMAFAVTVCTLAVHTGTVRLVFAMARDGALPFSAALAHVGGRSHTPVRPALLVGALGVGILVVNMGFPQVVSLISGVAIVWANLAYLFITIPLLGRRLRGEWAEEPGGFSLGRMGTPVNAVAVLWGIFMCVNVAWPRPEVYGADGLMPYAAWLLTAGLLAIGGAYYGLVQRHRPAGVLPEHQAAPAVELTPAG